MAEIYDWDVVAANNNATPPDGWPENMAYNFANNTAREDQAAIKRDLDDKNGTLVTTGTPPNYELAPNRSVSLLSGLVFGFRVHSGNSGGATTLNVAGTGPEPVLLPDGSDPVLATNGIYQVVWNDTLSRWQLLTATVAEATLPAVTDVTTSRTLTAGDLNGPLLSVRNPGIVLTLPQGLVSAGNKLRIIRDGPSNFDIDISSWGAGALLRTDGVAISPSPGIGTFIGPAYTLVGTPGGGVVAVRGLL